MESPKTRVNFSMVPKHVGQYVCVVGKNLGVSTGSSRLCMPDVMYVHILRGSATVLLSRHLLPLEEVPVP